MIQRNRTDNIFTLASLITNEYSLVNFSNVIEVIDKINQVKDDDIYVLNLSEAVLKEYRFISSIDSYIEENPCMDSRIEHLSKMFNMSRSTFIRLFSKHSNMPFHQWVIRKKLGLHVIILSIQMIQYRIYQTILVFLHLHIFPESFISINISLH